MTEILFKVLIIGDPTVGKTSFVQRYVNNCYRRDYKMTIGVLIIGHQEVGKTSYVQRYVYNRYRGKYKVTMGVDFALKVIKWSDSQNIKLQLWDIAGQERFTSMTRVYYKDAHACIVMFDLTQRLTFQNAVKWKKDLDDKCSLQDGSPVPCLLLANKCDLSHREVEQSEIEDLCKEHDFVGWTEISVKEGLMVEESMRFLVEEMMSKHDLYGDFSNSLRSGGITISGSTPDKPNSSMCQC